MNNKILVLVQISLIFVGCGLSNPNQTEDVIAQNRKRWERQKIVHYQVTQKLSCFCPSMTREPKIIEVDQGKIIAINGIEMENGSKMGKTIPEFFDWIEEKKVRNPFISEYNFDEKYGFPNMIYFKMEENMEDEELRYVLTDFEILD